MDIYLGAQGVDHSFFVSSAVLGLRRFRVALTLFLVAMVVHGTSAQEWPSATPVDETTTATAGTITLLGWDGSSSIDFIVVDDLGTVLEPARFPPDNSRHPSW